jgi:hypothetical protein
MALTDEEWIDQWHAAGRSPAEMSRLTGITQRNIYRRRDWLEARGNDLKSVRASDQRAEIKRWTYPAAIHLDIQNGCVLVGGDSHFWPGQNPVIWQAFVKVAHHIKPDAIILNGDICDFTRVSRHPAMRNQNAPRVSEELSAAYERIGELPLRGRRLWNLGNHCIRLDNYLANQAPEVDDYAGCLADRFRDWEFTYSTLINGNTEVRHLFSGGIQAAYTNAVKTGINIVTNHTHGNEVRSIIDRRGIRYAIETGMLNDPGAPQFEFDQGVVRRCAPGFSLLSYDEEGMMLPPERCEMFRGRPYVRGYDVLSPKPRVAIQAGRRDVA